MRKSILILVSALLFIPYATFAQVTFEMGLDRGAMMSGEDKYEAGSNTSLAADVAGDYFAAGGTVDISKKVSKDTFAAGGTVLVSGESGDDVRLFGGTVIVDSQVSGDLMIFGGNITVRKGAKISGNTFLNGGAITYEGETMGDVFVNGGVVNMGGIANGNATINTENIKVLPGAKILGNLAYSSFKNSPELESATSGQKSFKLIEKKYEKKGDMVTKGIKSLLFGYLLYRFIFLALFASLLYFGYEKMFKDVSSNIEKKPGKSFLYGFLYFAAMPFAILIALLTFIGIPIGLFLLFIYIFSFVFYKLITVTAFSAFFINKYLEDKTNIWKKLGIIILVALFITPWSVVDLIFAFFAFGAVMQKKFELYNKVIER